MPDGLYERDALAWSEQQADRLKLLASRGRSNAHVGWPRVIEQVSDLRPVHAPCGSGSTWGTLCPSAAPSTGRNGRRRRAMPAFWRVPVDT